MNGVFSKIGRSVVVPFFAKSWMSALYPVIKFPKSQPRRASRASELLIISV